MLNAMELKEKLQALAQNDFQPSGQDDLRELIPAMLEHIGSTDSTLRDDLIYSAFCAWIAPESGLSPDQMRALLPVVLDEQHMLYKIGEQDTDSVFTRSFSILVLPLLLAAHRAQPLFSGAEIFQIKSRLLYYLERERDRRGFVNEKGWAHAIAHTADALDDLVQCPEMDRGELEEVLSAIRQAICFERGCYTYLEDERMITAVIAIFKRNLVPEMEIMQWLDGFSELALAIKSGPEKHTIRVNARNFLQSLYFRLRWEGLIDPLDIQINQTLRKINPFAN